MQRASADIQAMGAVDAAGEQLADEQLADERIRVAFADSGAGITKEKLARFGEPFFSTKEKGTGLGLMVSHKIIENHGGLMEYESEVGRGTTVSVYLPAVASISSPNQLASP